ADLLPVRGLRPHPLYEGLDRVPGGRDARTHDEGQLRLLPAPTPLHTGRGDPTRDHHLATLATNRRHGFASNNPHWETAGEALPSPPPPSGTTFPSSPLTGLDFIRHIGSAWFGLAVYRWLPVKKSVSTGSPSSNSQPAAATNLGGDGWSMGALVPHPVRLPRNSGNQMRARGRSAPTATVRAKTQLFSRANPAMTSTTAMARATSLLTVACMPTQRPNAPDRLPGRLQGLQPTEGRTAGPVN